MGFKFDVPQKKEKVVASLKIVSFSIDIEREEMYISFDEKDIEGNTVGEVTLTYEGEEYINVFTQASMMAKADIAKVIKTAIYKQAAIELSKAGVVT